jgi:hypothetical protein
MLIGVSCDEKVFTGDVDCDECYTEKQEEADLVIELTVNNQYPRVPVTVYNGNVEDNDIVAYDTATSSPFYFYVPTDKKYSVKAQYTTADITIYAIDGTNLKVLRVSNACDESCYVVENYDIDVRIKRELAP